MDPRFSYDPSKPICENDHVLFMDHMKRCFVIKVERDKYVKICKDKFKVDTLIGLNYGQIFTKVDNEWIKVDRKDDRYRSYWDLLDQEYQESDDNESPSPKDNRKVVDNPKSQKLTAEDINKMKKEINPGELITTIVQNSETFQSRTSMSKEKYIRRKEFRHLKLFEIRHCDLMSVCESYFAGFPHKIGYLKFESLGMMLHLANVHFDHRSIVFDHTLGLLTGAIAQRLQGTGRIYRLVTKGVADKIVHELGVNYFENILSVDFDEVMKFCKSSEVKEDEEVKPDSKNTHFNEYKQVKENKDNKDYQDNKHNREHKENDHKNNQDIKEDKDEEESVKDQELESNTEDPELNQERKRRKRDVLPGVYPLKKVTESDLRDVELVIGNVSFNKCRKDNQLVNQYTFSLVEIANKFLKNDGRLVVFGQHFQPLSHCYSVLTRSNEYINVRLEETFVREYQVKPMCTHPIITKSRPCCGFMLSAIKVSGSDPV